MLETGITSWVQKYWFLVTPVFGVVIGVGAILNWDWLCNPTGKTYSQQ